jgi:acetyltransferase-like isoleucine patch superfamily enzyme
MLLIKKIYNRLNLVIKRIYYSWIFSKYGTDSIIISPLHIHCPSNIEIGNNVTVQYKTWLAAVPHTGAEKCLLKIGNGCSIGHLNHIYATKRIVLEDYVLTADKVFISDNLHDYKDITTPVLKQPVIQNGEVVIGYGSWLGENVCVLGAKIGKQCVIGANSVVTDDIPNYCVAAGVPAKIIKRYNFDTKQWEKTDCKGNFINPIIIKQ